MIDMIGRLYGWKSLPGRLKNLRAQVTQEKKEEAAKEPPKPQPVYPSDEIYLRMGDYIMTVATPAASSLSKDLKDSEVENVAIADSLQA